MLASTEERVELQRGWDWLRNRPAVACSTTVPDMRALQAAWGPGNAFETALRLIIAELEAAKYKSEVIV